MSDDMQRPDEPATGKFLLGAGKDRETRLALYIAFLAALLAICSMIDDQSDKNALAAHLERTNLYGYYQSKNIRSNESLIAVQTFTALGKSDLAAHWQSEYDQHEEGKKKILADARAQETLWQLAERRGVFYKVGVALMQIAIVLASAALVTSGNVLVVASTLLTGIGAVYMLNGLGPLFEWLPTNPAAPFEWLLGLGRNAPAPA